MEDLWISIFINKVYYFNLGGFLSEKEALLIFEEICKGFKIMQQNKIIHRDIKP